MISRTGFLILGLLSEGPLTGYEIRKTTLARFRFFWNESYGQIYPQLKKLDADGFIRSELDGGNSRGSIHYSLRPKGRKALEAWLDEGDAQDQLRLESVLRIYLSAIMGLPSCAATIREFEMKSTSALADMERMRARLSSDQDPHGNHAKILSILDLGIRTYAAWAQWASETELSKEP